MRELTTLTKDLRNCILQAVSNCLETYIPYPRVKEIYNVSIGYTMTIFYEKRFSRSKFEEFAKECECEYNFQSENINIFIPENDDTHNIRRGLYEDIEKYNWFATDAITRFKDSERNLVELGINTTEPIE